MAKWFYSQYKGYCLPGALCWKGLCGHVAYARMPGQRIIMSSKLFNSIEESDKPHWTVPAI